MSSGSPLVFKFANEDWEFEQIHRLNYRTFVEEIPQHERSASNRLVDKFHAENTYLICLSGSKLVGMLAVRGHRPFSLDQKLEKLDSYLPAGRKVCEIRLLAVEKKFRGAQVLQGILALLWQHGVERGYDLAIISGTTRQFKLYQHLGFVPFGPVVGSGEAQFQPMYVTLETFEATAREFLRASPSRAFHPSAVNFLPGPVTVRREVRRAFEQAPESHRGDAFLRDFCETKQILCDLVQAKHVELFLGSGTLANDVVAGQLSLLQRRGLVLSNGEFGQRLVDHARRFGLLFDALEFEWGSAFDLPLIRRKLQELPAPAWIWCTHCETSTSVLNHLTDLKSLCSDYGARLCLDCISSIGTVPVDLTGIYLASGSSGKGLRSYPGMSMVFYHHDLSRAGAPVLQPPDSPVTPDRPVGENMPQLPRYLDLALYADQQGIPFTSSSNLLHALHAAVKRVQWDRRYLEIQEMSAWLRSELRQLGFELIGDEAGTSPAVVTLALPRQMISVKLGDSLRECGYLLSYNSDYLRRKNWIQICLMGECAKEKLVALVNALNRICPGRIRRSSHAIATAGSKPAQAEIQ